MFRCHHRRLVILVVALAFSVLAACSSSKERTADSLTLTVYTDQHTTLVEALTSAYTEKTGVKFQVEHGATVGQIEAAGSASPADLFLSEDPGPVVRLAEAGLLESLPGSTVDQVRPGLSDPTDRWVAYAAHARVLYYNRTLIKEADLPARLTDITAARYKGQFAYAPSAAFVATIQYLIETVGLEATTEFLQGVKANGVNEHEDGNVRDPVEAGTRAMGLSNHDDWWLKAAEAGGPGTMTSKIYNFPETDPGNLVIPSGVGILASSKQVSAAADFVAWLTDVEGGQAIIASDRVDRSDAQYPVAVGATSTLVGSLDDVKSPTYDMSIFTDQAQAEALLRTLGMSK